LAAEIGLNESIFLLQLNYKLQDSKNFIDGRYWMYDTHEALIDKFFPFWSTETVKRTAQSLKKQCLITIDRHNQLPQDKTSWYTINYNQLSKLEVIRISVPENYPFEKEEAVVQKELARQKLAEPKTKRQEKIEKKKQREEEKKKEEERMTCPSGQIDLSMRSNCSVAKGQNDLSITESYSESYPSNTVQQSVSDTQASPVTENGKGGEDGNPLLYLDTQKEEEEIGKGKEAIGKGKGCRTLENGILPEDGIPQTGETDGRGEDTQPEKENGTGSKEEFLARIKKGFGENSAEYELANILFYQDAQKLAKKYRTEYRFPIGDAEKFNSYKARIGRKPSSKKYYVAATNLYEMMPQSGKDKIDAYVNYELEMWDTSRTDDIESLRRKIMYEYFSLEPCFLHYYAMNEKQREYYKNRKPKKKKKKLDKELDRIYKDCGLDRNKDCDPGLDYDYEAGNLTEDELKAKLLAEVAA
jgi:hypothetical protein